MIFLTFIIDINSTIATFTITTILAKKIQVFLCVCLIIWHLIKRMRK